MNITNSSSFNKNLTFNKKNTRFIIKNNSNIKTNLPGSNAPQSLQDTIKKSLELNTQQALVRPVRPSSKTGIQDKMLRVNPKEEVVIKSNLNKGEFFTMSTMKPEINMDDYVLKTKYEELERQFNTLQRKYDMSMRMNAELKEKNRELEHEHEKQNKKLAEGFRENRKLERTVRELQTKNEALEAQTQSQNRRQESVEREEEEEEEEAKVDTGDIQSLRLAMRFEAENILLNQLSQIAQLQMLFDRTRRPAEIDFNNPEHLNHINPDNMTYEELLQLQERIGHVSKGLTKEEIKSIEKYTYHHHADKGEELCSICFAEFETGAKVRKLPCHHEYHSKCIKQWLTNEKTCPICKKEVISKNET